MSPAPVPASRRRALPAHRTIRRGGLGDVAIALDEPRSGPVRRRASPRSSGRCRASSTRKTSWLSSRLFGNLARNWRRSAGEFSRKASTIASCFGVVKRGIAPRSWRSSTRFDRARRGLVERDGERLREPPRQGLCFGSDRRRRPPGPGRPQQCRWCDGDVIGGAASRMRPVTSRRSSPPSPRALKRSTQARMTLQTDAADPRRIRPAATIVDLGPPAERRLWSRVPGPLREAPL